jgi:hypothetical protein
MSPKPLVDFPDRPLFRIRQRWHIGIPLGEKRIARCRREVKPLLQVIEAGNCLSDRFGCNHSFTHYLTAVILADASIGAIGHRLPTIELELRELVGLRVVDRAPM